MEKARTEKSEKGMRTGEMPENPFERLTGLNFQNFGSKAEN